MEGVGEGEEEGGGLARPPRRPLGWTAAPPQSPSGNTDSSLRVDRGDERRWEVAKKPKFGCRPVQMPFFHNTLQL